MVVEKGQIYQNRNGERYIVTIVSKDFTKGNHLINKIGRKGKLLSAKGNLKGVSNDTLLNERYFRYIGKDESLLNTFHFRGRV